MESILTLKSLLPKHIIDRISGKLLGDGNISIEHNRKPRLRFSHCLRDKDWAIHCYTELKDYVPFSKPKERRVIDSRIKIGFTDSIYVQSLTSPIVISLLDIWYIHRKKIVPFDLLYEGISPVTLAWWYQDDGHLKNVNGKVSKIILSTDSFSKKENIELIELLNTFYKLTFRLDGQNRLILYEKAQILYFLEIIQPYLHSSMQRKFFIPHNDSISKTNKRTTIYLPSSIHLKKPTSEIHNILANLSKLQPLFRNSLLYQDLIKTTYLNIKSATSKGKGYQVVLNGDLLEQIEDIKQITGLTRSQIVYLCYILQENQ
ncbi:endonuclease [Metabacillus sp. FJAT-53654]|uniref:Endonuclease n=1 Tax=Metabacillus rhizosphaerae TaxID=3117747 RepID=A0ABZ2MWK1_9BACI